MKKKTRALRPEDVKPDTIVVFEVHDDGCPFDTGKPCICTPTKTEMTVAQVQEIFSKSSSKTVGETLGHGKSKH